MTNSRYQHRLIFVAHNGPGPYSCYFCQEPVSMENVIVHHIDEDHFNDISSNLTAAHARCHGVYHGSTPKQHYPIPRWVQKMGNEAAHTPEANAKRAASLQRFYDGHPDRKRGYDKDGRPAGGANKGMKRSPEARQKMREAALRTWASGLRKKRSDSR